MSLPVLLLLVLIGSVLAWLLYRRGGPPGLRHWRQIAGVICAAAIFAVPFINRLGARWLDLLRHPSSRARASIAAMIWAISVVYLLMAARQQHRDLYPRIHDECSYTIQTRMLADGKLWMPAHELADFFETFHFLTRPVYGSIYFPGTALMNVPGVWLHQPSWVIPLLLAGLVVAMSYLVAAELIDGASAILVALLILSTASFRTFSTMVMAQVPMLLLSLLMAFAYLRWRRNRHWGWAAAVGFFAGWAAITRPLDALAFAVPIGLAMAWELRRGPGKTALQTIVALILGALPFLELQAAFDWGVTGNPWKTPYVMYLEHNQPGSVFGQDQKLLPSESRLPQKQIYFAQLAQMNEAAHRSGRLAWLALRLRMTASAVMPCGLLLAFIPAGFMLGAGRGRWVVLAAIPLFFALYAFNPFFLLHYSIPLTGALAIAAVLGAKAVEYGFQTASRRRFVGTVLSATLAGMAIASLPQLDGHITDELYRTPLLDYTQAALSQITPPAVVLFRFARGSNVHEEPVYNFDVAWPDDAPIVRAHDLGPRDGELLRYYALRQPRRTFWLFDRATGGVYELGNASQAAVALHVSLAAPRSAVATDQ